MGLFDKIKARLGKSRENLAEKVEALVVESEVLDDDFFDELTDILILADVGMKTTVQVVDQLRDMYEAKKVVNRAQARDALKDILVDIMKSEPMRLESPMVLLVIGVNGVGKTTSIGKLTARLQTVGRKVIICAADTFRAAAAEQLTVWAQRADAPIVKRQEGADPASVVYDGVQMAKGRHADVLLVDTAGRLHNKAHLMEELKKISRVVEREYPEAKLAALLVIDATTGQNGLQQALAFKDVANLDGIILTKLDGTAKGGIAVAIRNEMGLPVRYIGVGEQIDDMQPFEARDFVNAIL